MTAPIRTLAEDLEEARFEAMTTAMHQALSEAPEPRRLGGSFDGSTLTCRCICHVLIGEPAESSEPRPSSCIHCQLIG